MSKSPIRSRRRPKLKVVSDDSDGAGRPLRHRAAVRVRGVSQILEIWTPEEWRALPQWEKPDGDVKILPGIGLYHVRDPFPDEWLDVVDLQNQLVELWNTGVR